MSNTNAKRMAGLVYVLATLAMGMSPALVYASLVYVACRATSWIR